MLLLAINAVHVVSGVLAHRLWPPYQAGPHHQQVVREQQQNEAGTEHCVVIEYVLITYSGASAPPYSC